jgi:hypothetical protein
MPGTRHVTVRALVAVAGMALVAAVLPGMRPTVTPASAAPLMIASHVGTTSRVAAARTRPRAQLTGNYEILPSGKVQVIVISNAKKVTLTYRSAKNKKRTTTIRLRRGWGQKTLAVGYLGLEMRSQ